MNVNRRDFLKITGSSAAGAAILGLGLNLKPIKSHAQNLKINHCKETTSICCYCAVGCGVICSTSKTGAGKIINIEGDPDHPINQGHACAKGGAQFQISAHNPRRLQRVKYRAPGSSQWEEKSWSWAIEEIAKRIKNTRDSNWTTKDKSGYIVNRTQGIASLGGASLDNEECYLLSKLMRALGLVYIEHQARI